MISIFSGRTECGKSWLAEKLAKPRPKVIYYDYARYFTNGIVISDFSTANFIKLLKKYGGKENKNKKFKLIFRKPSLWIHEDAIDKVSYFVKMLGGSYGDRSLLNKKRIVFLIDEADKLITGKSSDRIRLLAQAGRHENIDTWAIVQRPMRLHPDVRDNLHEAYAFRVAQNKFYEEILGKKITKELGDNKFPKYWYYHYNENGEIKKINSKGREVKI